MRHYWIIPALLCGLLLPGRDALAWREHTEEGPGESQLSEFIEEGPAPEASPKVQYPSYGSYTKVIKNLCSAMARDGRSAQVSKVLEPHLVKDTSCPSCYSLFKIVSAQCRDKVKKLKKGEAPPPPISPQREPNIETELAAQDLAAKLISDEKRLEGSEVAVVRLRRVLVEDPTLSPGAREYFDNVLSNLDEAIASTKADIPVKKSDEPVQRFESELSVDDIFNGES